jgi:hypothetical protein
MDFCQATLVLVSQYGLNISCQFMHFWKSVSQKDIFDFKIVFNFGSHCGIKEEKTSTCLS